MVSGSSLRGKLKNQRHSQKIDRHNATIWAKTSDIDRWISPQLQSRRIVAEQAPVAHFKLLDLLEYAGVFYGVP